MTIGSIGQSNAVTAVSQNAGERAKVSPTHSHAKKDTAEISQEARNLAAQKTQEGSPTEESTESAAEKLQEQIAGSNN